MYRWFDDTQNGRQLLTAPNAAGAGLAIAGSAREDQRALRALRGPAGEESASLAAAGIGFLKGSQLGLHEGYMVTIQRLYMYVRI